MSQSTLTPGNVVVHEATGERGTLISTNGYSAVVEWDTLHGRNPADILPVTDIEPAPAFSPGDRVSDIGNGRLGTVADDQSKAADYPGMLEVQWDAGWNTIAALSILAPVADGIEHVSDAELHAELEYRGIIAPPAGFTLNADFEAMEAGLGEYDGPKCTADTWEISAAWNKSEGLTYFVDHTPTGPWTPAELDAMQTALAQLRSDIEGAAE